MVLGGISLCSAPRLNIQNFAEPGYSAKNDADIVNTFWLSASYISSIIIIYQTRFVKNNSLSEIQVHIVIIIKHFHFVVFTQLYVKFCHNFSCKMSQMIYLWSKKWSERRLFMSRRGDNIRKRKDGRWEGRYRVLTAGGERYYKSVYAKSYNEVKERWLTE